MVDQYASKLIASGYGLEQTRKILLNGIKSYETRRRNRQKLGLKLRSTAKRSQGSRIKKKLLGKSSWYKSKKKKEQYTKGAKSSGNTKIFFPYCCHGIGKRYTEDEKGK